ADVDATPMASLTNAGLACPRQGCNKVLSNLAVVTQLESQMRQHTARYYEAWLVCDDPACGNRTRQMSVYGHRCLGPKGLGYGCLGRMSFEYSEKQLYNQLLFLQSMFDVDKGLETMTKDTAKGLSNGDTEDNEKTKVLAETNRARFATCQSVVKGYLDKSGWGWVSMDGLFGFALKAFV
ncbi:hypothetical protein LTR28_012685, partial [Elasticomyces elasticus]